MPKSRRSKIAVQEGSDLCSMLMMSQKNIIYHGPKSSTTAIGSLSGTTLHTVSLPYIIMINTGGNLYLLHSIVWHISSLRVYRFLLPSYVFTILYRNPESDRVYINFDMANKARKFFSLYNKVLTVI